MAALQRLSGHASTTDMACSYEPCKVRSGSEQFPVGLRVLVVDDDITCLMILEKMLRKCMYHVKTCSHATAALRILRESKGYFDLVLSDVHMPDMDGFKLLELVGLEMDLPVIMISVDMSTSTVMRGVRHGACDYLIKPIREEELKNIWQHVVRKRWSGTKELDHSGSLEGNDWHKRGNDDAEYTSSVNEGTDVALKAQRKRSNVTEEDDGELENDDPATAKKPRVVWSVELHQQFVSAVNQLGIDSTNLNKAVPKRILELMNIPGLTRENVASHLQKFRLYLKRLSVGQPQGGISNSFCGSVESNLQSGSSLGRFDLQPLAVSAQIPPQTLACLQAELFGQTEGSLVLPAMDQQALLQAPLQGSKCIPVKPGVAFSQPLIKSPSNLSKTFAQSALPVEDVSSGMGAWPYNSIASVTSAARVRGFNAQNGNILGDMLQQQHQHHVSMLQETNRSINVQPSCLVVPSHSPVSFLRGNSPASVNQNCSYTCGPATDCSLLSPQSNNSSLGIGHGSDGDPNTTVLSAYSVPGSLSPSLSSCSMHNSNSGLQVQAVQHSAVALGAAKQLQGHSPYTGDVQDHPSKSGEVLDQGPLRNLEFVGKGTYIPSRFAVDELESPSNSTQGKIYGENDGNRLKQEPNLEFVENVSVEMPRLQNFS